MNELLENTEFLLIVMTEIEEYPESNSYTIELVETLYGIYSIELIDATLHNSNYIVGKYNDKYLEGILQELVLMELKVLL